MRPLFFLLVMTLLQGCYALGNLDPLLRLKAYSDEKREQQRFVENANKKYDQLKQDYFQHKLVTGLTQARILTLYGEPIQKQEFPDGQRWIYRYGVWHKGKDKIYLQFNKDAQLIVASYEEIQFLKDNP